MPTRTADGDLVGKAVPYADADPATALEGDNVAGPIRTADGELVGRTALFQMIGGVATPITDLGGSAASQVTADPPIVVTPNGDNVVLSLTTDVANGVPLLDGTGLIKIAQMPISGLNYHGNWDASTNTPTLADGSGTAGDMYRVHVAGSQDLGSGSISFDIGDLVVYEGAVWQKFAAATGVISVNDQTGAVTLTKADVGLGNADNTSDADKPISTAQQAALDLKANEADLAIDRISGVVQLQLDGEELIWPNDISTGKLRLYNSTPASTNTYYGFGIANQTLIYQVDAAVSVHKFQSVDESDGAVDLLDISTNGGVVAHVDLHMSEKKIINLGNPDSARDAANKQYVDQAVAGVGGGHLTIATQTSQTVNLTADSPTVQLIDTTGNVNDTDITLPTDAPAGKVFTIKQVAGSLGITIDGNGPNIDGTPTVGIESPLGLRTIVYDGTNWWITSTAGA